MDNGLEIIYLILIGAQPLAETASRFGSYGHSPAETASRGRKAIFTTGGIIGAQPLAETASR
ncbi:MAG: hypothetical protein K2J03_00495 [Muribaculaceae bacterium]|nr:hypothetical protein [Muribaculaceae bacterium]